MSSSSSRSLSIFARRGLSKKIVFFCRILNDGLGDFDHLIDLVKHKHKILPDFLKDVIVESEHGFANNEKFKARLEQQGFTTVFVRNAEHFQRDLRESSTQPKAYILSGYISDNEENISAILGKYSAAISISHATSYPLRGQSLSSAKFMPYIHITGHAGCLSDDKEEDFVSNDLDLTMDINSSTRSIFLDQEDRNHPEEQLARLLQKPANSEIQHALIGDEEKATPAYCRRFLENNLFIPCYFQHNHQAFIDFMNIVQDSPLSNAFSATIFFVNHIKSNLLEKACLMGEISKKIKNIIIQTHSEGPKEIINPIAAKDAKTVKFIVGYYVQDNDDYNVLFHCAQYFGGASGDKTLEKTLANGLIPLFIPHLDTKEDFIKSAAKVFPLFARIPYSRYGDPMLPEHASMRVLGDAQNFDETFFLHWQAVCEQLKDKYNLHKTLPHIVQANLVPPMKIQELIDLIGQPDISINKIISFLESNITILDKIAQYYNLIFVSRIIPDDKVNKIGVAYFQIVAQVTQYLQSKTHIFNPKRYLYLAKILIRETAEPTQENLNIAKLCLNEFSILSNDNQSNMEFIDLQKELEIAFKRNKEQPDNNKPFTP